MKHEKIEFKNDFTHVVSFSNNIDYSQGIVPSIA